MSGNGETLHKICNNFSPSGASGMTPAKMKSVDTNFHLVINCGGGLIPKLSLTLDNSMDYSQSGLSVQGSFQARILEWVAMPFSRGPSPPRD